MIHIVMLLMWVMVPVIARATHIVSIRQANRRVLQIEVIMLVRLRIVSPLYLLKTLQEIVASEG